MVIELTLHVLTVKRCVCPITRLVKSLVNVCPSQGCHVLAWMSFSEDAVNALSLGCLATEDKGWTAVVSLFAGPWLGPRKLISGHASLSCLLTRLHLVVIASSEGRFSHKYLNSLCSGPLTNYIPNVTMVKFLFL